MKIPIKEIKLHRMKMKLNEPFTTSFGTVQEKEFFLIEAIDGEGHHGYGESVAFTSPWYTPETVKTNEHMIIDFLIPLLQKNTIKHPDELDEVFAPIKGNEMAKAAIEGAVWDLYAKRENISLAKALGGDKKAIDVGISLGLEPTTEALIEKITSYVKAGYKRVKIKIKPGHDVDLLKTVRSHFPELPLMADANSAYTLADIDQLKKLDDLNLLMIEQPLAHDDIVDHAKLQAAIKTPICLDESIHSYEDARKAIELGSCKIINIKIGRVGGLTQAKRIHDLAKEKGIDVWCGGMLEAGVGRAHNIALTSLDNFVLPGDTAGSKRYWQEDIIKPEVVVVDGKINLSDKPGIGYDIDKLALEKYRLETKTYKF